MTTNKPQPINGDGDQPVTQAEFSAAMTAVKQDLDRIESQMATKEDLEQVRSEMATKAELAKLQQMTERILELIESMDQKFKPLQNLPERMDRVERAIFP